MSCLVVSNMVTQLKLAFLMIEMFLVKRKLLDFSAVVFLVGGLTGKVSFFLRKFQKNRWMRWFDR